MAALDSSGEQLGGEVAASAERDALVGQPRAYSRENGAMGSGFRYLHVDSRPGIIRSEGRPSASGD